MPPASRSLCVAGELVLFSNSRTAVAASVLKSFVLGQLSSPFPLVNLSAIYRPVAIDVRLINIGNHVLNLITGESATPAIFRPRLGLRQLVSLRRHTLAYRFHRREWVACAAIFDEGAARYTTAVFRTGRRIQACSNLVVGVR